MFSVIDFPDEKAIEAVPSLWINTSGNLCRYPKGTASTVNRLIEEAAESQTTWPLHKCQILKQYGELIIFEILDTIVYIKSHISDDLERARAAADRGLYNPSVESDCSSLKPQSTPQKSSQVKKVPRPRPPKTTEYDSDSCDEQSHLKRTKIILETAQGDDNTFGTDLTALQLSKTKHQCNLFETTMNFFVIRYCSRTNYVKQSEKLGCVS